MSVFVCGWVGAQVCALEGIHDTDDPKLFRCYGALLRQVLEGAGKKPRELQEEMGIETDADAGVDIKDFEVA